jgi:hypothetical protein
MLQAGEEVIRQTVALSKLPCCRTECAQRVSPRLAIGASTQPFALGLLPNITRQRNDSQIL